MARRLPAPRRRTTTSAGPFREFLQDLRQSWSVSPGTSQPALRDYPLRRPVGGAR
jgi:hypothetical protein